MYVFGIMFTAPWIHMPVLARPPQDASAAFKEEPLGVQHSVYGYPEYI